MNWEWRMIRGDAVVHAHGEGELVITLEFGKHSADSSQRSLWSRLVRERGALCLAVATQGSAFTDAGRRTKSRLHLPVPHRPMCRGSTIPMPITWPLWYKSLLIILILNIKLK